MFLENLVSGTKKFVKSIVTPVLIPAVFSMFMGCNNPIFDPPPTSKPTYSPTPTVTATATPQPTPVPTATPIPTPYIPDNVEVIPENIGDKITEVNDYSIELSEPIDDFDSFSPGDVFVFESANSIPHGLLTKFEGMSSDKQTIYTSQASFDEVVKDYSWSIDNHSLNSSQLKNSILAKGVSINPSARGFSYNIDDVIIDLDENPSTTWDQIHLNGNISLDTDFAMGFTIGDSLEEFLFQCNITDEINITATALENLSNINKFKQIAEHAFPDIYFTIPTPIPIPVVITPMASFGVGVIGNISPLSTTVGQTATLTLGASYNGQWNPIHDFENDFTFQPPSFEGENNIFVYASGRVSAYLYYSVGAFTELKGGLDFESVIQGQNIDWDLSGKLQGDIGIDLGIFGQSLAEYSANLFTHELPLASGESSTPKEKILFSRYQDFDGSVYRNVEIYMMNTDGSNKTNITNTVNIYESKPSWSPDGKKIVFDYLDYSNEDDHEIFIMDLNTKATSRLTNNTLNETDPSWSPNGNKIAFSLNEDIYIMDTDGSGIVNVTPDSMVNYQPSWSPNSEEIIFSSYSKEESSFDSDIYKININTKQRTRITYSSEDNRNPSWSPKGNKIVFDSYGDIYIMNSDGSGLENLTNIGSSNTSNHTPSWSPDGKKIVYLSDISDGHGKPAIYIMDSNGDNKTKIVGRDENWFPAWSPVAIQE